VQWDDVCSGSNEFDDGLPATQDIWHQGQDQRNPRTMNRNRLYLIIGVLAVATVVLSYLLYQERQKTTGFEINVDESGISIEEK
jgi:hypothetical protein